MKPVVLALLLIAMTACGARAEDRLWDNDPYGVWLSVQLGDVLIVRRNGTYSYCDDRACESGQVLYPSNDDVVLQGFYRMNTTKTLRTLSGLEDLRGGPPDTWNTTPPPAKPTWIELAPDDLGFVKTVFDDDDERLKSACRAHPCRFIAGGDGRPDYFLLKVRSD